MNRTVPLELGPASYQIHIGKGLLTQPDVLLSALSQKKVAIVSNPTVAALYMAPLRASLESQGVEVLEIILPDGEEYKTWETLNQIFDSLLSHHYERKTTLIALGGGVIGDMTGFAAAVYQRGIPFIQIPTTLLAQVDSSVGGKTAINHPHGKNMIGAFYQPRLVLADLSTLDSLPLREFSAGMAEVIKYGLIDDLPFFEWLEGNIEALMTRDESALAYAVERCCRSKARIVEQDERETTGMRELLNLGHTFGHAIEAGMGYGVWLHGEAVAAGIMLAGITSRELGHVSQDELQRVESLLQRSGLPVRAPDLGYDRYIELMSGDKKVESGRIRFILMRNLGLSYATTELSSSLLSRVLEEGCS